MAKFKLITAIFGQSEEFETYLFFWCLYKCVLLYDLNESHVSLHEGKPLSNAVARAPAKQHVVESWPLCFLFRVNLREKIIQMEPLSIREEYEGGQYLSGSNFSGSVQNSGF